MLSLLREDALKLLNSPFVYWYGVLRQVVYPMLALVAMGFVLLARRRLWTFLFVVTVLIGLAFGASSGAKMPAAMTVLILVLMYYLCRHDRVRRLHLFGVGAVLFLSYPVLVQALSLYGKELGVGVYVRQILVRIFESPAEVLYYNFEIVPAHLPHLGGATSHFIARIVGKPYFDFENYAGMYLFGPASTATASAPFLGALWVDFGMTGVVLGGVLAGFLMQLTQVLLIRQRKTVLNLALYAFLLFAFAQITIAPLPYVLYSGGVIFAIVFAWGMLRLDAGLVSVGALVRKLRSKTA